MLTPATTMNFFMPFMPFQASQGVHSRSDARRFGSVSSMSSPDGVPPAMFRLVLESGAARGA